MKGKIEQRFVLHDVGESEMHRACPALRQALLPYDGRVNGSGDQLVVLVTVEMDREGQLSTRAVEVVDAALDEVGLTWADKRSWTDVRRVG